MPWKPARHRFHVFWHIPNSMSPSSVLAPMPYVLAHPQFHEAIMQAVTAPL
ncbi:hypothetical protein BKA82DRAFT_22384 [Pisolithus tinctorius]|uniref:Uncharacterized protein n=1 Tax=Pisolithus tinctorius Marx 270 TaxID=870435 RepID=A0A0C3PLL8_PISTI|nr:hypothetical protein BKA82DRAFT_22384 [Pisolithus tinctorius]KIO09194.1 hypothetical protein M404DRAFT_22384 [Pisolithus tinctorius Marx 270]